jgi:NADH-quinone oxidoreductase subunit J
VSAPLVSKRSKEYLKQTQSMVYETIAFALFALVTLGCSLGVVLVRDVWHSALLLGGALLSVAVHYVMLQAEFLAAMQILVYVGGVLILITFAVMLTQSTGASDSTARQEVSEP